MSLDHRVAGVTAERVPDGRRDLLWPRPRWQVAPSARPGDPPAPAQPTAVVIVTHQSASVVAGCLRSLPGALAGVADVQVIVVDNASTDGTVAEVRRVAPRAEVLAQGDNRGYAAGVNAGIAAARSDADILVLNPDIRLQPGAVARLRDALAEDGVGIAVPRITDGNGVLQPSLRRRPTTRRAWAEALLGGTRAAGLGDAGETIAVGPAYDGPADVDWATGAAFLVSRGCLDDIGPLDESFFLYSEETDFMLRAGDAGRTVRYTPRAHAVHLGGELSTAPRLWSLRARNRLRLQRRRAGRWSSLGFLVASVVGEGLRAAAGRATSRAAVRDLLRHGPGIVVGPPPMSEPATPGWICFSAQDWWYQNRAHSDIQLLGRVAGSRRVLLVNSIGLRMPVPGRSSGTARRIGRKLASVARLVRRPVPDRPDLRIMTPLPLPFYRSALARRCNAWFVGRQVDWAARASGLTAPAGPDPVVVVTIPTAIDAARRLPHAALVVNRSDKHSAFPEADGPTIAELEHRCLDAADLVIYTSQALEEDEGTHARGTTLVLDHGVDAAHFTRRPPIEIPADLAAIAGPRVGFFGALDDYLVDFDLLEELAAAMPDTNLVLIGDATCPMRRFARYPNVHLLGARPYEQIPAYGSGFDVALMPWLDSTWIRYANPIKLKEYLALGLPIVSTDFPEVHRYGHLLRIAPDAGSFIAAVADTLDDGGPSTPEARREAVAALTWDRAAADLLRAGESAARRRRAPRTEPC